MTSIEYSIMVKSLDSEIRLQSQTTALSFTALDLGKIPSFFVSQFPSFI